MSELLALIYFMIFFNAFLLLRNEYICKASITIIRIDFDLYKKLPTYFFMLLHPKYWLIWTPEHWMAWAKRNHGGSL